VRPPLSLLAAFAALTPTVVLAQEGASAGPPVIDTIIFTRDNVFPAEQVTGSTLARAGNAIHVRTAAWVMRSTILFHVGDTLDLSRLRESERTLRALNVFREVSIDTATRNGKLAVLVDTRDAWSLSPKFSIAGSGGDVTLTVGVSEKNLLGTASLLSLAYVKLVDRDGLDVSARVPRIGSRLTIGGAFQNLSAGNTGNWDFGMPYRAFPDPFAVHLKGQFADELRFQWFRQAGTLDSLTYDHYLLSHRLNTSVAALHSSDGYLRVGVDGILRSERYVLQTATPAPVTDSLFTTAGITADFRSSHFIKRRYFQGFGQDEDIDLSPAVHLTLWVAPAFGGYETTGLGPEVTVSAGKELGGSIATGSIQASGLFNSAGLDSGRVVLRGTWAGKLSERTMAFLHVETGAMKGETPGTEFDLGLTYGPRTFGAHAWVGDRTLWGTLEWRDYRWADVFGFLGIGYAAFADYGSAWYDGQDPVWGGNVGVGLRLGSVISSKASAAKIDFGYRFGQGFDGKRLGISFGASYDIFTGTTAPPP
jgi:hypothetical protein